MATCTRRLRLRRDHGLTTPLDVATNSINALKPQNTSHSTATNASVAHRLDSKRKLL
ncbi:hypothetical protein D3C87_1339480 [compost metagenome]